MKKRFIIVGLLLVIVFGGLFGYHFFIKIMTARYLKNYAPPPVTVNVLKLEPITWNPTYSTVGSAVAIEGTDVSPIVTGMVTRILFNSGDIVKKNQVLAIMDIDVLTAQLANAKATMIYDQETYERYKVLYSQGVISAQDLDQATSNYEAAKANVAQQAALLGQKYITAPFAGRVGIRLVSVGQYLNAGTVVTNIQELNPIYVNFQLPEQFLQSMYVGQPVSITVDTFPGMTFQGKISSFDAQVGDNTKSITVQATFKNDHPKALILPGMQANVTVHLRSSGSVLAVPQEAINYSLYGNTVFVVKQTTNKAGHPQTVASEVAITPGDQEGDLVQVSGGLQAGDAIVVDGTAKLQNNNMPISVVNETSQS